MAALGTRAWADSTQGTLSTADKLTMLRQEVQRQITMQWRHFTGRSNMQVDRVDLDAFVLPDTPLAVAALALCESVAPRSLLFHSLRTYLWGCILAQQDGLPYDAEMFYVMAVLHDLRLCPAYNGTDRVSACFAVEGGRAAGRLVREYGTDEQARQVEAAIIMHLNLYVPPASGVEQHLLPAATTLDVVGARLGEIKPETVAAVLERYPRLTFKADLIDMFNQQYAARPQSRIAFMQQVGNLNRLIVQSPFES